MLRNAKSVVLLLIASNASLTKADEIVIQPDEGASKDCVVKSQFPDTNYDFQTLRVGVRTSYGPWRRYRTYIQFKLSSIPPRSTITSATLALYGGYGGEDPPESNTLEVQRVKFEWSESRITWGNQKDPSGIIIDTAPFPKVGWNEFDVTKAVQNWFAGTWDNDGFLLKARDEGETKDAAAAFHSSGQGLPSEWPKLTVVYEPPPPELPDLIIDRVLFEGGGERITVRDGDCKRLRAGVDYAYKVYVKNIGDRAAPETGVGLGWNDDGGNNCGDPANCAFPGEYPMLSAVIRPLAPGEERFQGGPYKWPEEYAGLHALVGEADSEDQVYEGREGELNNLFCAKINVVLIPCEHIKKFRGKCRRGGKVKGKVVLTDSRHNGQTVTIGINADPVELTIKGKKAKFKECCYENQVVISLDDPARCVDPIESDCP